MPHRQFDTICSLPLPSELFAQVLHPTQPLLTLGLASGHVYVYRLPSPDDDAAPLSSSNEPNADDEDTSFALPPPKRVKISTRTSQGSVHKPTLNGTTPIPSSLRRASTASAASESGLGSVDTLWSTKRHKGSCRALALSHDGNILYSAGEDGIVKVADSSTGQVLSKIALPIPERNHIDAPTVLHALSPMNVLVGTDTGTLCVYDARDGGKGLDMKPSKMWANVQSVDGSGEHINSIAPVPATAQSTSGFSHSWCCVGGSTVAVIDLRKGVVARSEEQDDELGPSIFVSGVPAAKGSDLTTTADKLLVGSGNAKLNIWERGRWNDPIEGINTYGASESLCALPPDLDNFPKPRIGQNERLVAMGLEDGFVRFVKLSGKGHQVVPGLLVQHDVIDAPIAIAFDVVGRMVTGGGNVVKVWTDTGSMWRDGTVNGHNSDVDDDEAEEDDESDEEEDSSEDDSDEAPPPMVANQEDQQRRRKKGGANHGFSVTGF